MKPLTTYDIPGVLVDHLWLSFDGFYWSMDNIAIIRYYRNHLEGSMASSLLDQLVVFHQVVS